jgi:hypothetical protein
MRSKTRRFVYVIRSGDFAKVGSSRDPLKRMLQLERAMPIAPQLMASFEAFSGLEQRLHRYLSAHHARHEWFHWCDKLENLVKAGLPSQMVERAS